MWDEWGIGGFKVGINKQMYGIYEGDDIAPCKRNAVMIGNNTLFGRLCSQRITKKYDLLYSQRAYVHWFVGEGMEEGEFGEAREDLGFLEKDYLEILGVYTETEEDYEDD